MDQPILFEYTSAAVPIIDELKPTFLSYDENNFIQYKAPLNRIKLKSNTFQ